MQERNFLLSLLAAGMPAFMAAPGPAAAATDPAPVVRYEKIDVAGHRVFYREAGPANAPTVLLLHGFPSSSHMYRDLIPRLAGRYHVIAPDLPGFGFTEVATNPPFRYTFDNLAEVIEGFTVAKKLDRYALYVFDYGAPVGWRLAAAHPERVTAIVSQNGNAYEEGLSAEWTPIQAYWESPTTENRLALRAALKIESTKWQYTEGVRDLSRLSPDGYTFDQALLDRPGQQDIQLDLMRDYASNVALYPSFHAYFRNAQPPFMAIWGRNDPYFLPAGAEAFKRDLPRAEVSFLDTGHFALETHGEEIAAKVMDFLRRTLEK